MPDQTTTFNLDVRETLTATMKAAADAVAQTGNAGTKAYGQLVSGLNATSKATQTLNNDLKAQATLLTAESRATTAAANETRAHAAMLDAQTRAVKASTAALAAETSAANQAARAAQQAGATHTQATSGVDGLWKAVAGGTIIGNLATKALSEIGQVAGDVFNGMLKGATDTEQFTNAFTRMLGSKAAADDFLTTLRQFSLKTPFDFEGSAKAAQSLINMGMASKDVVPLLTAMGDAVAANGGKTDEFNRAMLGYTQIMARGKTSAQDLNQISQAGVPIWDLMAAGMGKTRAEVVALNEAGAITSEVFAQVFQEAANSKYAGAMAGQMNSLAGAISSVSDLIQSLGASVLGPSLKVVEEGVNTAVTALQDPQVQATLAEWGTNLGKVAAAALDVGGQIVSMGKAALEALRPVTDLIGGLIGALPNVKAPDLGGTGTNPVAPLVASTKALNTEIDLSTLKANDYHTEIQAAQDTLTAMKRGQEDQKYALDRSIDGERRKLTLLEAQYAVQDRATSVKRAQQKLDEDTRLSKDVFSGAGQAAGARLAQDQATLEDLQTAQTREGEKARVQARINGLEDTKKAQDRAGQVAERSVQDEIAGLQRRAAFEASELERRKKQYTDDLAAWKKAQEAKAAKDAADNAAADAREDAHFALISKHSTDFTTQLATDGAAQSKVLADFKKQLDEIAVALGFPNAAAALKDLRYQFAITASFIGTHMDAAGQQLTHDINTGAVAGLKARQLFGGTLDPAALAFIKKWDTEQAGLDKGNSLADSNFAAQKHALDVEFGKIIAVGDPAANRNLNDATAAPGRAQSRVAPPTGTVGPTPKATGGGGWGMGSIFGAPDLSIDPTTGKPYTGRARGGHQAAGETGWVGEHGPELWRPDTGGTVIPMDQLGMGGGGDITVRNVVEHLCPSCLERTVDTRIKRVGSRLLGSHLMASMG